MKLFMTDFLTSIQRHANMAAIHGKDTKPEMVVRRWLWGQGFRYRLNHPRLPGKPDIVMRKYRTCIFVNGCFWHGHDCKKGSLPADNADFWREKIAKNKIRDKKNQEILINSGFHVIVIWECELKNKVLREQRLTRLVEEIKK